MIQYHNNNNMSLFPKGIEDIHTHDVSRSESAVVNISPSGVFPDVIRWASVGIHPWNASVTDEETFLILEEMASDVISKSNLRFCYDTTRCYCLLTNAAP